MGPGLLGGSKDLVRPGSSPGHILGFAHELSVSCTAMDTMHSTRRLETSTP
ncbi:hypothetical protein PFICI_14426 [Pestalotiopsis fici W106-1]|uniref:Uncharacterized protein n=1 Tax=Pestalotiopsis fici (strain W106-1 / CGMCC3.15140) TaxID=1229662 RepID=W3WHR9_PESFW|nr:uncharacterized protein PFICI_14426 [Pestalotiopsis fici W106-1]ETS73480.1 hypothetical protein PFICI_14426 [Pestalotiopsis fici W106-1]